VCRPLPSVGTGLALSARLCSGPISAPAPPPPPPAPSPQRQCVPAAQPCTSKECMGQAVEVRWAAAAGGPAAPQQTAQRGRFQQVQYPRSVNQKQAQRSGCSSTASSQLNAYRGGPIGREQLGLKPWYQVLGLCILMVSNATMHMNIIIRMG
jgi:hypothetical protein